MAKYCKDCLHRYICDYRTIQDNPVDCKEWLADRTVARVEKTFYEALMEAYDIESYQDGEYHYLLDKETITEIAKEFGII
jgi:hypothetical protein